MKVSGTISSIIQSKKNPKIFRVSINNEWYSIFAEEKIGLTKGVGIEAEYKEKGTFKNIDTKSIKIIQPKPIPKEQVKVETSTEDLIMMQSVLKASASYSKNTQENINNARILFKFLKGE